MMPGARRLLCALACALLLAGLVAPGASAKQAKPEPQATLPDIADEVMCLVCGVLLDESPDSPQAQQEVDFIRRRIAAGETKDQIKDDLVAQYGENVLAEPSTSGFDLMAWVIPGGAIVLAGFAIAIGVGRWRRATEALATLEKDEEPLDPDDKERLDSDLARYDL
jgi:cytochrome c-type biogenesis protein CcmH